MKQYQNLTEKDEGYICCPICHEMGFPEDGEEDYEELSEKLKRDPTDKEAEEYYDKKRATWEMFEDQIEWFEHLKTHTKESIICHFREMFENGRYVEAKDM